MIRFGEPTALYLLASVPLVGAALWWGSFEMRRRRSKLGPEVYSDEGSGSTSEKTSGIISDADRRLSPEARHKNLRRVFVDRLMGGAWLSIAMLLVVAIARPQGAPVSTFQPQNSLDIVVAIDVSESMLAADIRPSRIERARREVLDLLAQLRGERVGLVIFSGTAFVQTPLTNDYATYRTFLDLVDPSFSAVAGSNVELALYRSLEALGLESDVFEDDVGHRLVDEESSSTRATPSGAILLLTDGEIFEGDHLSMATRVGSYGVPIYALGVGTEEGAPIPHRNGWRRDQSGKLVTTKLNLETLSAIAKNANGFALRSIADSSDIEQILQAIRERETVTKGDSREVIQYAEYFQVPLGCVIACLIALCLFSGRDSSAFVPRYELL